MTAVLGILNKNSIALAADSAVTVGLVNGDSKIFNRANKLFTLSKYHPVGIMIYNSASFMHTPWEIIIKLYRKQLNKKSFDTLREYQTDFIDFLHKKNFFVTGEDDVQFLFAYFHRRLTNVKFEVAKLNNLVLKGIVPQATKELFLEKLSEYFDVKIQELANEANFCDELADLELDEFNAKIEPFFDELMHVLYINHGYNVEEDLKQKIKLYVLNSYKTKYFRDYTGLVFAGFGEEEIYPQLVAVQISSSFNNRLRYYVDENQCQSIATDNSAAICPFAQTDVMQTILAGIDPVLENMYNKTWELAFLKFNQMVIDLLGDDHADLKQALQSLPYNQIINDTIQANAQHRLDKNIHPLMNAVNELSKEDLAEMAESLIYLTYLKRRITFAQESVGGPVDVAIISKGDGFIWIKRKLYFKPELNHHFTKNYFLT